MERVDHMETPGDRSIPGDLYHRTAVPSMTPKTSHKSDHPVTNREITQ
jgi:hypothetical protein